MEFSISAELHGRMVRYVALAEYPMITQLFDISWDA